MPNGTDGTGFVRLGDRLREWLRTLSPWTYISAYFDAVDIRMEELRQWLVVEGIPRAQGRHIDWAWQMLFAGLYPPTGLDFIGVKTPEAPGKSFWEDPSDALGQTLRGALGNPVVVEFEQILGSLITDSVLSSLEVGLEQAETNPLEAARSFHGAVSSISVVSGLFSTIVEAITAGQIENAGDMIQGMYWNLGLGFLGWQTLAPLLENGLQPPLQRHYNRQYHPQRFNASQMADLFALGEASADDVRETLRDLGWRDEDISQWIRLSYRALSEGDVWSLYHNGDISQSAVESRLRALGYNPEDFGLIFKANEPDASKETKDILLSTAKNAYKKDLISADDFANILRDQDRPEQEVQLQLSLLNMQKAEAQADFTRSEVRTLYNSRVIAEVEAVTYLIETGLTAEQAGKLIDAWAVEDAPKPVRINQSTLREAFTDGVLTRAQAQSKLNELGYTSQDADLIVTTWETETLPVGPVPGPTGAGALSLSLLSQMAAAGLINEAMMLQRPELNKYSDDDRARIVQLMYDAPTTGVTELAESVLVDAYRFDIIDRSALRQAFIDRGLPVDEVELGLQVIDRQIAEERQAEIEGTIRRPSVGALQLALQREIITVEQFTARMTELGFDQDAVQLYLLNAQYQAPAKPKQLTAAQALRLYEDGDIVRSEAQYRLVQLGYTVKDAQLLIKNVRLSPIDTEVGEAYLAGLISYQGALEYFDEQEFSQEQIGAFFEAYPAG